MEKTPRPNPICTVCRKLILPGAGRIRSGLSAIHAECEKRGRRPGSSRPRPNRPRATEREVGHAPLDRGARASKPQQGHSSWRRATVNRPAASRPGRASRGGYVLLSLEGSMRASACFAAGPFGRPDVVACAMQSDRPARKVALDLDIAGRDGQLAGHADPASGCSSPPG